MVMCPSDVEPFCAQVQSMDTTALTISIVVMAGIIIIIIILITMIARGDASIPR